MPFATNNGGDPIEDDDDDNETTLPPVKVHSEMVEGLDYDHNNVLHQPLIECSDEALISELARRKVDIQHRVTSELVEKHYKFEKLIGHGASAKVYLVIHRDSGQKYACKVIEKNDAMNDTKSMATEIQVMKRVRHRHVVSLYELFESAQCMWLIMELVEGTGLRGGLDGDNCYPETVASRYVKQMLQGLHYLHHHGIIHRDMKIDNILIHGDARGGLVKIADFGLSALIKPGTSGYAADESGKRKSFTGLKEMWGTPTHYAPELIDRAYGPQADMWSLGCMMYEMLTGTKAFPNFGIQRREHFANIKAAKFNRRLLVYRRVSPQAIDLIERILEPDPMRRLSASEALKHPWIIPSIDSMSSASPPPSPPWSTPPSPPSSSSSPTTSSSPRHDLLLPSAIASFSDVAVSADQPNQSITATADATAIVPPAEPLGACPRETHIPSAAAAAAPAEPPPLPLPPPATTAATAAPAAWVTEIHRDIDRAPQSAVVEKPPLGHGEPETGGQEWILLDHQGTG